MYLNLDVLYIVHSYYFSICKICKTSVSWAFTNNHGMYCQVCAKFCDLNLDLTYTFTQSRWFKEYYGEN